MLFNLLLDSITILLCFFFLFLVVFNCFTNPVVIENASLKLALIISTGAPITAANVAIEMLPVAADKTMTYQNSQKKQYMLISSFFSLSIKIAFNFIDFV